MSILGLVGFGLCSIILGMPMQTAAASCEVKPIALRCEYLVHPLGLDIPQPRLSWQLAATDPDQHGQRQTSYRILVASGKELLQNDRGDLWDSGVVKTNQSVNVAYAGKPLHSGERCFWKVRVTDQKGVLSVWSKPSWWTVGLLHAADWKAEWIGARSAFSPTGNPPALPEDSRSLTAPGVVAESDFREPLEVYERTNNANV